MPDGQKILVIDDDPSLLRLLEYSLQKDGYTPLLAMDGRAGLRLLYEHKPDLVVLDITMPAMDGWTTCQRIREISDVPIIMLTALVSKEDLVRGLDLGADDYLAKPFEVVELLARIRANLRRVAVTQPAIRGNVAYSDGFLSINVADRRITREGKEIRLTKTEFDLLAELVRIAPKIATYRALLENVWGFEYIGEIKYLRTYVWQLRRKIEPNADSPIYIVNVRDVGYRFEQTPTR